MFFFLLHHYKQNDLVEHDTYARGKSRDLHNIITIYVHKKKVYIDRCENVPDVVEHERGFRLT